MSPPDWVRPVGLDVEVLRGIRGPSTTTAALLTRIEEHLERWQGYVAFSGGKDSLVVLDLARRVEPQVPVVFFDSGLEYPQTYPYLEDLAARWRLNLRIIDADPPLLTLLTHGGRWDHHAPIRDAGAGTIQDWPTREVWAHIAREQLPLNPVYGILRRIGAPEDALRISHLIDGGRLENGRLTWLRRGWPDLFDELATLLPRIREFV